MDTRFTLPCWAVTAPGLEFLAAEELRAAGIAPGEAEPGGVSFDATPAALASVLVAARTIGRVTVRVASFTARTFAELERHAERIGWHHVIAPGQAVHFRVTSKKSRLYHQDAIAERLERVTLAAVAGSTAVRAAATAEALEDALDTPPPVQRIIVRVMRDVVTLSADASGALMHLRGWRQAVARAPLRETLAASMVQVSGWDRTAPLHDPFCGAGTVAIEAALAACDVAPGLHRRYAAESWPMLPGSVFSAARANAAARIRRRDDLEISGSDRDAGAIGAAIANAERAGMSGIVRFTRASLSDLPPRDDAGAIVTNPPYGARIGERTALRSLYQVLGRVLRERRPRWSLTLLGGDRMLEGQVGVPFDEVAATTNGGLPVRLLHAASLTPRR